MRRIWLLLILPLLLLGCSTISREQSVLADELYLMTMEIDTELLNGEDKLPEAIRQRDATTIEALIIKADDFKREWKNAMREATGKVAEAANAYAESLDIRIRAYEAASRTARYYQVEDSREMVRLQEEGWDMALEAEDRLESLGR